MPFLVLLILALAYLQNQWPEPPSWLSPIGCVVLTWAGAGMVMMLAGGMVRSFRRRLSAKPEEYAKWFRRYSRNRWVHLITLVAVYFAAAYLIGWGWTVKQWLTFDQWSMPGSELLIILPFLAGLFLSWARFYDAELAVEALRPEPRERPIMSRWAYVGLQARQSLILAAPPFLLLLVQQCVFDLFPALRQDDYLMASISGLLLALLFVGQPWLLRILLNLKPMPSGRLRERLECLAKRLNFRYRDILVWHTSDTLATAMLTGPLPVLRYVVFTDRLLNEMDTEEVEAVFGHEVGHVRHRHMFFYLVFLIISLFVLSSLWNLLLVRLPLDSVQGFLQRYMVWPDFWIANLQLLLAIPMLLMLLLYFFVVFGFLSRRCERQADLFACQTVSIPVFVSALEKVASLNGISKKKPGWIASWRHGTIAGRIACLEDVNEDPKREVQYQQNISLLKWGTLIGLTCLLLILGPERIWEILRQL